MIKVKEVKCLLKPDDFIPSSKQFRVIGTMNPGAVRMPNGEIILYVRIIEKLIPPYDRKHFYSPRLVGKSSYKMVLDSFPLRKVKAHSDLDFLFEDGTKRLKFISHLRRVVLGKDGFTIKEIDTKPTFFGLKRDGEMGVEDPRIVRIDGKGYVMTYVTLSKSSNVSSSYAVSKNMRAWKREGIIFREQNKDVVIFPEKINGKYYAINRPEGTFQFSSPHMWIAESNDLNYWGEPTQIELGKDGTWDSGRVGAGTPPIKTKKGWLLFYHGVIDKPHRAIYGAGAVLLDLNNPRKVISKTKKPIIMPHEDYEKGVFEKKDVVFPTGVVWHENKEDLLVYSGGGDIVTSVRQISLKDIMRSLRRI